MWIRCSCVLRLSLWWTLAGRDKWPARLVRNRRWSSADGRFPWSVLVESRLRWLRRRITCGKNDRSAIDRCLKTEKFTGKFVDLSLRKRLSPSSMYIERRIVASSSKKSLANSSHHWWSQSYFRELNHWREKKEKKIYLGSHGETFVQIVDPVFRYRRTKLSPRETEKLEIELKQTEISYGKGNSRGGMNCIRAPE